MSVGRFQCGVAALIYDAQTGRYLLLRRSDARDFGAGDWEGVTGRVDQGESFEDALHREVSEELGVTVKIEFIIGTSHFYRGAPIPENELLAVKYSCHLDGTAAPQIGHEHSEMRWFTPAEIYVLLPETHWLAQTVRRAEIMRKLLPEALTKLFLAEGFDSE